MHPEDFLIPYFCKIYWKKEKEIFFCIFYSKEEEIELNNLSGSLLECLKVHRTLMYLTIKSEFFCTRGSLCTVFLCILNIWTSTFIDKYKLFTKLISNTAIHCICIDDDLINIFVLAVFLHVNYLWVLSYFCKCWFEDLLLHKKWRNS